MHTWINDSRRPALNPEEGALLPAMASRHPTDGAALRTAMEAAREMANKQLSDSVSLSDPKQKAGQSAPSGSGRGSRAALHQVMRRGIPGR